MTKRTSRAITLYAAVGLLAACGGDNGTGTTPPPTNPGPFPITDHAVSAQMTNNLQEAFVGQDVVFNWNVTSTSTRGSPGYSGEVVALLARGGQVVDTLRRSSAGSGGAGSEVVPQHALDGDYLVTETFGEVVRSGNNLIPDTLPYSAADTTVVRVPVAPDSSDVTFGTRFIEGGINDNLRLIIERVGTQELDTILLGGSQTVRLQDGVEYRVNANDEEEVGLFRVERDGSLFDNPTSEEYFRFVVGGDEEFTVIPMTNGFSALQVVGDLGTERADGKWVIAGLDRSKQYTIVKSKIGRAGLPMRAGIAFENQSMDEYEANNKALAAYAVSLGITDPFANVNWVDATDSILDLVVAGVDPATQSILEREGFILLYNSTNENWAAAQVDFDDPFRYIQSGIVGVRAGSVGAYRILLENESAWKLRNEWRYGCGIRAGDGYVGPPCSKDNFDEATYIIGTALDEKATVNVLWGWMGDRQVTRPGQVGVMPQEDVDEAFRQGQGLVSQNFALQPSGFYDPWVLR